MAMSSHCCLNLPPLPDSNSIPVVKSLTSRIEIDEKPCKKRNPKLVAGLACAIIGLEMATAPIDLISGQVSSLNHNYKALSTEMKYSKGGKWSDRRRCPAWNLNSLETIVPENLPRPSAHRNWEAVAYDSFAHSMAPPVTLVKAKPGCFSM